MSPADLERALQLTPRREGNRALRRLLKASRGKPWSPAERRAHELLRGARIDGWEANRCIYDKRGEELLGYGDLVFAHLRLVIELEGDRHHGSPTRVAADKVRDLALAREGWEVVRIPASVVFEEPELFVASVRDILTARAGRDATGRS